MKSNKELKEERLSSNYTNEEINELAEWLDELTIRQLFFIRDSYEAHLQMSAHEQDHVYVQ